MPSRLSGWLRGRYQALLLGLFLMILVHPWMNETPLGRYRLEAILVVTLLGAIRASVRVKWVLILLILLGMLATASRLVNHTAGSHAAQITGYASMGLFFGLSVVVIVRSVLAAGRITADRIYGALAAYLLLAIALSGVPRSGRLVSAMAA